MAHEMRKSIWACLICGIVLLLGWVDWVTGTELNFFVFYFLPVATAAWFLGLGAAVSVSVLSAIVWFLANDLAGQIFSAHRFAVWNTGIRLVSFLSIGYAIDRMHQLLDREQATSAALHKALSEVKVLEAFLPICAQCKKIRDKQGEWQQIESYISQHSKTRFSHGYCPECAKKAMRDAGLMDN
jgi:K+-sensing histidine kinase KdpD